MSVFPFIDPQAYIETQNNDELPLFSEYAFDFNTKKLMLRNGKQYLVYENEAIKIWIYHALIITRYRHLAFTWAYGSELESLIGKVADKGVLQSEIRRFIIEALMVNPYIVELRNFQFVTSRESLSVSFDCETIYGIFNHVHMMERE